MKLTTWDIWTKSNAVVSSYLWSLFPDLSRDLILDAFRAQLMFTFVGPWEPLVQLMLSGAINCNTMVKQYRQQLIFTEGSKDSKGSGEPPPPKRRRV